MRRGTKRLAAVLAAAALTFGAAACGGSDDGDSSGGDGASVETVNFLQPLPESVYFYPLFVAEELGYFADEGVKAELLPASEDVPLSAFVENGQADIAAAGATEILQGLAGGGDYDVTYDYFTKSAEGVVVSTDSDIQSAEELEGTRVGLSSDEDRAFLRASLQEVGVPPDSVDTVTVGTSGPTVANAIEGGEIDAYAAALSEFAALQANGIELRDITPDALADTPAASFISSPSVIESKTDALAGFMRAWAKATYVGMVNPEVVKQMAQETVPEEWRNQRVGEAAFDVALESQTPAGDEFGELRPEVWEQSQEQLLNSGGIEEPVDIDSFLDDQFIQEANDWDRSEVEADAEEWAQQNP